MAITDKPIRYAPQTRQERISRKQFGERLDEFGWIANPPDEDLGQDFIVDIYFQGRAAGVNFYVQLKSVTNLDERRRGDYLVYDFKVKDLKYWETFELPVVLVVWDVGLRQGRWALVDTVITELDQQRPQWRNNKSKASVRIPWNNTTDDAGLVQLRKSIGQRLYPLIAQDKLPGEFKIKTSFPGTQEGRAAQHAFDRWVKEGEPVTIKSEYIEKFDISTWITQWSGEFKPGEIELTLTSPTSPEIFEVGMDFTSANGELTSYGPIQLKIVKAGTEIVQFSNEHQAAPLHFCFVIPRSVKYKEVTINFKINNLGRHVHETRDILRFLRAMATGGKLRLTVLSHDNDCQEFPMPPQPDKLLISAEDWQLVDKLCIIQDRTGQFLQMPIEGPTTKDTQAIDELIAIIGRGKIVRKHVEVTGKFKEQDLNSILDGARQDKPINLRIRTSHKETSIELLGSKIKTGRRTEYINSLIELPATELKQAVATLPPGEFLSVKLVDVEIIEIFPDWYIREAERLSQRLVDDLGAASVYLFGSLAWSDVHAPETDIDLAVSGLSAERYFKAVGYLERESKFPVDLVDLNSVPDHLRQRILAEGKKLNERKAVTAVSG